MRTRRRGGLIIIFGILTLIGIRLMRDETEEYASKQSTTPARHAPEAAPEELSEWVAMGSASLTKGIELAKERGTRMKELIRTHPERAIAESLSLSEWSALPPEIQEHVERPFSTVADVQVMIACGPEFSETRITTVIPGEGDLETFMYGRRGELGSKLGIPVQGIRLNGVAALRPEAFQELDSANEAAALNLYPVVMADPDGNSVAALAGGQIFYFRNHEALDEANRRLGGLEALPGPNSGPQSLEAYVLTGGGIDFQALEDQAYTAAQAWTGTPRNMYVIMVDYPDITGQPADPGAFSNSLNTTVSQQFWEMSYEKTHIVATVNANTYRMPNPSSYYTNSSTLIYLDATALAEADGVDLSPYETVCILFPYVSDIWWSGFGSIGLKKMLLNGSTSPYLATHELGHNYGSSHASSWNVASSNPVDPAGTFVQYGDFMDIMGAGALPTGHFNTWHKSNLGWLEIGNRLSVTNSGTYRVYRSDHQQTAGLIRGLEIEKTGGDQYWLGLRQEYPTYDTFSRGAYLLWKKSGDGRSFLLDTTPLSAGGKADGGLALGQTYSDAAAAVHITPIDRGGQMPDEWMDVTINLGTFPGNSPPVAVLNAPTNVAEQTGVLLSVIASDSDGDELAYYWDIGDGLVKPNSPAIPAAWPAVGTVTVSCTVSDMKGGSHKVSQAIEVFSSPLENWSQLTSGTTMDLFDIAAGNERLVAVGKYGKIVYSDDVANWTEVAISTYAHLNGIIHDGSKYIAAGYDYDFGETRYEGAILTSADGITWARPYLNGEWLNDVAYGDGVYVAVGAAGTIIRSTDGVSWSSEVSGSTSNLYGVSYGDGTFVAVGFQPSQDSSATVLTSADGLSWSNYSAGADLSGDQSFYDVQYCNDRFLASGFKARIMQSINQGLTFTTSMTGTELQIPAFAYGAGIYFAAGFTQGIGAPDINLISADGVNWSELATAAQNNRNAAIFYNDTFITVGNGGAIWQSDPVTAPPGSGYGAWQLENALQLGLNRDPLDDADFDGFWNLWEYAMGTTATDAGSMPEPGVSGEDGGYFTASYERGGKASDVNYSVERASNLVSNDWDAADTVIIQDDATNLTARSVFPMATQTNEFMRLELELK